MSSPSICIINSFPSPTAADYTENLWYRQHHNDIVIINAFVKKIWFPAHWSPLSVKCAFGGQEYYHFGKATLAAGDKNFLIVNEGAVYESSVRSEKPVESFTLNFTPQNIRDICNSKAPAASQLNNPFNKDRPNMHFVQKMYPYSTSVSPVLLGIRRQVRERQTDQLLLLESCYDLLETMVSLQKQTTREIENIRAFKPSTREEMYKRLTLARDYMESCYADDITLHDLSRICFLNPCYLLRAFKQYYAVTPHRYLTRRRLEKARTLLQDPSLSIRGLAKAVGYQDPGAFTKLFKKHYGLSPEQYRESGAGDLFLL